MHNPEIQTIVCGRSEGGAGVGWRGSMAGGKGDSCNTFNNKGKFLKRKKI